MPHDGEAKFRNRKYFVLTSKNHFIYLVKVVTPLPDKFPEAPLVLFQVPVIVLFNIILVPNVPLLFSVAMMATPPVFSVIGVGFEVKLFPLTM